MDDCPMYQLFTLAGTLSIWQIRYCTSEFESCDRYQRSSRGDPVPLNLLPNGQTLNK